MLPYTYNRMVHMNTTIINETLTQYGWNSIHDTHFAPFLQMGYLPARIIREGRGFFRAIAPVGELLAQCSGTFLNLQDLGVQPSPVIGDWCALSLHGESRGRIEAILPRQSEYHRSFAQDQYTMGTSAKVVAANIDKAAIVQDAKHDFNVRRIERFLTQLHTDGIPVVLVLTKADLLEDSDAYRRRMVSRFPDYPLHIIDSISGIGINALRDSLKPGETLMLVGTSGAGKSTLVNRLCNQEMVKTAPVREKDGRGRHTTSVRQIHLLSNGALLLDTPGVRTVGMHSSGDSVHDSFSDIAQLASTCKFTDCTHRGEPGCAVQKAVRDGFVEQDRYFNFLRLTQEAYSWEEVLQQSKKKKREIGTIKYQMRRMDSK